MSKPEQRAFQVGCLTLAGQYWSNGSPGNNPVIALHGWMDNSASFQPMADYLANTDFLALDLAGHGTSSWRSSDSAYNIWMDVAEILQVADQMGWQHFSLLGHSRGAMISLLLAAVAPERVVKVAVIDGLYPIPVLEEDAPKQLAKAIKDKQLYSMRRRRRFSTIDDLIRVRTRGANALTAKAAELIVARGVSQCEEGYRWSADPRLQGASEVKLTDGQLRAFAHSVKAPVQLYLAKQGMGAKFATQQSYWELIADRQLIEIEGGHQCHMEEASSDIANQYERFLSD